MLSSATNLCSSDNITFKQNCAESCVLPVSQCEEHWAQKALVLAFRVKCTQQWLLFNLESGYTELGCGSSEWIHKQRGRWKVDTPYVFVLNNLSELPILIHKSKSPIENECQIIIKVASVVLPRMKLTNVSKHSAAKVHTRSKNQLFISQPKACGWSGAF